MRVTFNTSKTKEIAKFFSQAISYLDVVIQRNRVYLILTNGIDVYCQMDFPVVTMEDFENPLYIRVERKSFLAMLREGHVYILIEDEERVELGFVAGEYTTSVVRSIQRSNVEAISRFFDILERARDAAPFKLEGLARYSSLLRSLNTIISCQDGIVHASFGEATQSTSKEVQLYIKNTKADNFTLSPTSLYFLLNSSDDLYLWKDNIIGYKENTTVVMKNLINPNFIEIDWMEDDIKRRSHVAEVDLSSVCALANTCNLDGRVVLDVESQGATFTHSEGRNVEIYRTKFKVHRKNSKSEVRTEKLMNDPDVDFSKLMAIKDDSKFPKLAFETGLMKNVLTSIPRNNLTISVRKKRIIFDNGGSVYIVVRRHDVE